MTTQPGSNIREPYIIAETAYNHEGDLKYLYRTIDGIAELGVNAIKFHLLLNLDSYMHTSHPEYTQFTGWIYSKEEWDGIIDYSRGKGLDIVALCDDVESIEYIIGHKKPISAIELHATGLNDYFLLEAAVKFERQVILGISGSPMDDIQYAVSFLKQKGKTNVLLMYGFQSYPTSYSDINLSKMINIRDLFNLPMGYTDHTAFDDPNNEIVSIMGAVMGFSVLEKHFTPDYGKERIDYHSAVGKEQMLRIKELMKLALIAHGDGSLGMSQSELNYGNIGLMKKAIVSREDIHKGEKLSLDNLWFKRTGKTSNIRQSQLFQLVGLEAIRDIKAGEIIDFSMVQKAETG